jgi:hypothetical protein
MKNLKPKNIILILFTTCCVIAVYNFPRISQDATYHSFADQRNVLGVFNFYNVITNLPFLVIGVIGLTRFLQSDDKNRYAMISHVILFGGVIGIGLGSAWYHYDPTNDTLVWDRIPMTITFMSYFSIILSCYVNLRFGQIMLFPLLIIGVLSVLYWYLTEQNGDGDLRLYALIQFYPMLGIPLILFLYPAARSVRIKIVSVIVIYIIAKLAERGDELIYNFHHIISGHSLKHLFASASVLLILLTLKDEISNPIDLSGRQQ